MPDELAIQAGAPSRRPCRDPAAFSTVSTTATSCIARPAGSPSSAAASGWRGSAWSTRTAATSCRLRPPADSIGYVDTLHLNVRGDPRGPGMTVTAIRTGQPVSIADPRVDPMFTTLKEQVLRSVGSSSAVSLPLVVEGQSIGALTVYGPVVNTFGVIEVELLQHLADDISFKLEVIGREERRRRGRSGPPPACRGGGAGGRVGSDHRRRWAHRLHESGLHATPGVYERGSPG